MAQTILPAPAVAHSIDSTQPTDPRPPRGSRAEFDAIVRASQMKLWRLYQARASLAVAKARDARDRGATVACRGFYDEARFWRRSAGAWLRRAQGGAR